MKVSYKIKHHGLYEFRPMEIDLAQIVRVEDCALPYSGCGFTKEDIQTIVIDKQQTARDLLRHE